MKKESEILKDIVQFTKDNNIENFAELVETIIKMGKKSWITVIRKDKNTIFLTEYFGK